MKKDTNMLGEGLESAARLWNHRKIRLKLGKRVLVDIDHTIPGLVQDTIDALWPRELKPLVVSKKKKPDGTGWNFVLHLPPGISYRDFAAKETYFRDATGGAVVLKKHGKAVVMTVLTDELKSRYPYQWEPGDKMYLPYPIGYSAAGFLHEDLANYPNLFIAGHPGAGKSNMLHVILCSLLCHREVWPVVIDLKRTEYEYLRGRAILAEHMPEVSKALEAINAELDKRAGILKRSGVTKNQDLEEPMPWILLVVDELAELHDKDCQEMFNRIVRLGRAPGICCVAATQRPSSTLFAKFGDSKAMFAATICFKVRDEVNSRMVLDNDRAALIPEIPGRAVYQWDKELEVQTMDLPLKKARKLIQGVPKKEVMRSEQQTKRLPPRQANM